MNKLYVITHNIDNTTLDDFDINHDDNFVWTNMKIFKSEDTAYTELSKYYKKLSGFKFFNFKIAVYKMDEKACEYVFESFIKVDFDKLKTFNK